jgi:hypothetical protein
MLWIIELIMKELMGEIRELKSTVCQSHTEIMSAISDFAAKQKAFNDRQSAAVDGLVTDVKALNDKIEELQNTPGPITPEDQALLDEIEQRSDAITARLEALDEQTPPVAPPITA